MELIVNIVMIIIYIIMEKLDKYQYLSSIK